MSAVLSPVPRPRPRWILGTSVDHAAAERLSTELRLPLLLCELLVSRGLAATDDAKRYLRPRLEQLHDPLSMMSLDAAVERLARAVRNGETIMVHGDYDVDGICSTTLMTRAIRALGGTVVPFIPQRLKDGYDLGEAGVRAAVDAGAHVVLTCDCGTSARVAVAALREHGIDVIISDHHLPGGALPECLAVLNPKRPGCEYPDKDLAAVGVAFKLALALTKSLGGNENVVLSMLDLVALATVADIAPLRGENRIFVRYGLRMMSETRNVGLRALIRACGLEGKALTAGRVGFILAPRLNAIGRLKQAMRGVELLLTEDEHQANAIARELEETNRERQDIDRETLAQARKQMEGVDLDSTFGIVLADSRWHPGVIGIVASRIVEEFCRPTVLIAITEKDGKGSGRSIPAFDLHSGLSECRDLLIRFGGHRSAAGVTVDPTRIQAFADRFNEVAKSRLSPDDLVPDLRVDMELPIDRATEEMETLLRHFEPFGIGNPGVTFVSRGVRLSGPPRTVGSDGLKLRLVAGTRTLEALGWGMASRLAELDVARPIDVAFRLERDEWQGMSRLQAKLCDFVSV